MRIQSLILATMVTACVTTAPALSAPTYEELSKSDRAETRRFAANNSLFVLYHELAHLLFDELGIPVLGREEDAADNMATWTLLNKGTAEANQTLEDSANGWILSGVAYDSGGLESDYAAAHSLDKQRAYQIVCLMFGSDKTAFRAIANEYALETDRRVACPLEYNLVERSFKDVLALRSPTSGPQTKVHVTYHDAGGSLRHAADAFRSSGVFDEVADELRSNYRLSEPVQFNARRCGEANAFYDPETTEVIFCYELMQDYMDLYVGDMADPAPVAEGGFAGKDKDPKN